GELLRMATAIGSSYEDAMWGSELEVARTKSLVDATHEEVYEAAADNFYALEKLKVDAYDEALGYSDNVMFETVGSLYGLLNIPKEVVDDELFDTRVDEGNLWDDITGFLEGKLKVQEVAQDGILSGVFGWLSEAFASIAQALTLAFEYLSVRLEDIFEIPSRLLFNLLRDFFFQEVVE
ncbi:unnamed protein product, partial [marine sediment metagenome]